MITNELITFKKYSRHLIIFFSRKFVLLYSEFKKCIINTRTYIHTRFRAFLILPILYKEMFFMFQIN